MAASSAREPARPLRTDQLTLTLGAAALAALDELAADRGQSRSQVVRELIAQASGRPAAAGDLEARVAALEARARGEP